MSDDPYMFPQSLARNLAWSGGALLLLGIYGIAVGDLLAGGVTALVGGVSLLPYMIERRHDYTASYAERRR